MRVKIERITMYPKNAQGEPYVGKWGAYSRCQILTTLDGEKRTISGIAGDKSPMNEWKEGQEIEVDIEKKVVGDKTYYNFKIPNQNVTRQEFDILTKKVKFLGDEVGSLHKKFDTLDLKNRVEEIDLGPEPSGDMDEPPLEAI